MKNIDAATLSTMSDFCKKVWNHMDGRGYARIDFRVDKNNVPYVLEVNGNPCIAPYGGFVAATQQAGYAFTAIMDRVVADALR